MKFRIGTRTSKLALIQTEQVRSALLSAYPDYEVELQAVETSGDLKQDISLAHVGGKGLFILELEEQLRSGDLELAVHSLKDVPAADTVLPLVAYLPRGAVQDVLIYRAGMDRGTVTRIGTSSPRRASQLRSICPQASAVPLRGNVQTRLRKLAAGECDAMVLAAAGLERLDLDAAALAELGFSSEPLTLDEMVPAAGQGILAVQAKDLQTADLVMKINDEAACLAAQVERAFVAALNGNCATAVGALAEAKAEGMLEFRVFYEGRLRYQLKRIWPQDEAPALAKALAQEILARDRGEKEGLSSADFVNPGRVTLLGAGPGAADLLTLKGAEILRQADLILSDSLVSPELLALAKPGARIISVGKRAGRHLYSQAQIDNLLVNLAKTGHEVLRLKGGDPYLFGRGGEEVEALQAAGIPVRVIPGLPSPVAALSLAGIPLTHRDKCSAVMIVTGGCQAGAELDREDYARLAALLPTSLIFMMSVSKLAVIARGLIDAGAEADTALALVTRGSLPDAQTYVMTLEEAAHEAGKAYPTPGIIVVGPVAEYAAAFPKNMEFRARSSAPVLVGTIAGKNSNLKDLLIAAGAEVISAEVAELYEDCWQGLGDRTVYDYYAFSSPESVKRFFAHLRRSAFDLRDLGPGCFYAVGQKTEEALAAEGIFKVQTAESAGGEALAELIATREKPETMGLVAVTAGAESALAEALDQLGFNFFRAESYGLRFYNAEGAALGCEQESLPEGICVFATSIRVLKALLSRYGAEALQGRRAICIAARTADYARKAGLSVIVSKEATLESMVETWKELFNESN